MTAGTLPGRLLMTHSMPFKMFDVVVVPVQPKTRTGTMVALFAAP